MTLVLALANEHEVHISCDFKLTDANTGRVISVNGHKLVPVGLSGLQAVVGVTGFAALDGLAIGDWIAESSVGLGSRAKLDDLIDSLCQRATPALQSIPARLQKYRHLTFVIAAIQGSQAVLVVLSNYQRLRGRFLADGAVPGDVLYRDVVRPSSPRLVIAGQEGSVRKEERKALERMLRGSPSPDVVREKLAELNRRAAGRVATVSEGCTVATELATGRGAIQPFLVEQSGDFITPDFQKVLTTLGLHLNPAIGPDGKPRPIQMRGASSAHYNPSPQYFREQFKLQPHSSELWNNYGAYEAANHRLESASEAYEAALALDPANVHASRNLGALLWSDPAQRQRAEDLFEIAHRADDMNFRRETASLLAALVLESDGDCPRVRSLHREATRGDPLVGPSASYGIYLLQYCPGEGANSAQLLRSAAQLDPKNPVAAAGMALLLWFEENDIGRARALIEPLCVESHREYPLIATAVKLAIADGDIPAAKAWLRRLERIAGKTNEAVAIYDAYLSLLEGRSLDSIESRLRGLPGWESRINESYLLWAQGKEDAAYVLVDAVDQERVAIDARRELEIVRFLLNRAGGGNGATAPPLPRDRSLLKALSAHPELADDRRALLTAVIGGT